MTGSKNNYTTELVLLEFENPGVKHADLRIPPVTHKEKGSVTTNGQGGILTRAEKAWGFLTSEERNEYSNRAFFLPIDGFALFFYEYLSLSGEDLHGIINAMNSSASH